MTAPEGFWLDAGVEVVSHYRPRMSEAYDLGYRRGFINAPRSEHFECYDSAGWLQGWEDGMADWDGKRGFRDT